jgi:ribosomal protein S18 acetylase RimI-like enzyme
MSSNVEYLMNKASEVDIYRHLLRCDADFIPTLSSRVRINEYARKIIDHAIRLEAWSGNVLIGLVAVYCNNLEKNTAFITSVSVLRLWAGKGIATQLMSHCIEFSKESGISLIRLELASENISAMSLYIKCGFIVSNVNEPFNIMDLNLQVI